MPHWSFLKATTGTGAMAASATISVTTCACHLKDVDTRAYQAHGLGVFNHFTVQILGYHSRSLDEEHLLGAASSHMLSLLGSATAYRPVMAPSTSTAPHRALTPTMQLHSRRTAIKGAASLLAPSAALFQTPGVAVAADSIWSITEPDFASATTTLLAAKTLAEYLTETEVEGGTPQTDAARKAAALNEERAKAREEQLKLSEERRASLAARAEEAAEERNNALEEAKVRWEKPARGGNPSKIARGRTSAIVRW